MTSEPVRVVRCSASRSASATTAAAVVALEAHFASSPLPISEHYTNTKRLSEIGSENRCQVQEEAEERIFRIF